MAQTVTRNSVPFQSPWNSDPSLAKSFISALSLHFCNSSIPQICEPERQRRGAGLQREEPLWPGSCLAPVYRGLSGTLKGSPQSPAGVPDSSCHCSAWEQGTLTPLLSVGKNTSLRMGEEHSVGSS